MINIYMYVNLSGLRLEYIPIIIVDNSHTYSRNDACGVRRTFLRLSLCFTLLTLSVFLMFGKLFY